ncbi:MAG: hypothetical protein LBP20_04725 [Treponema sp.]|nr:hypothetical protein [Treponema sp.]
MRNIAVLAGLFYAAFANPVISAQTYLRVLTIPSVHVYIAPMESGTQEEQEYFMDFMTMEFVGAAYEVVDTLEESDYNVVLSVSRTEPDPDYDGPLNAISLTLFDTRSGRELVNLSWDYDQVSDMDMWNLYLITQAMSNAPIIKMPPGVEMTAAPEEKPAFRPRFYLGMWAGGSFNTSVLQDPGIPTAGEKGYEWGVERGFGGEAAALVEFRPFRFLSFQVEAVFMYDAFNVARRTRDNDLIRKTGTFQSTSLMFPLLVKVPVELGKFTLSPFVGAYFITFLGPVKATLGDPVETDTLSYGINPPFGITLGIDTGLSLKSGELFVGLRFDQNIGTAVSTGDRKNPQYSQYRLGLSLGYKFSFAVKQRGNNAQQTEAEQQTETEQGTEEEAITPP